MIDLCFLLWQSGENDDPEATAANQVNKLRQSLPLSQDSPHARLNSACSAAAINDQHRELETVVGIDEHIIRRLKPDPV